MKIPCSFFYLLTALISLAPAAAAADSESASFGGDSGALVKQLGQGEKAGTLLDTGFSDPAGPYDTVMINGEMPGVLILKVCVRDLSVPNGCTAYSPTKTAFFRNGRFWAKFSLGRATSLPFRLTAANEGGAASGTFIVYAVEAFVDARPKEPQEAVTALQAPVPAPFPLVTRAQWGAKPATAAYTPHAPRMFTIHHTAGKFTRTLEESRAEVLFDQDYHQNKNGWIDIGYHFLIDPLGNIFEGRPVTAVGAHVEGRNTGNVGISVMGYYHAPISDQPTEAEFAAFAKIGGYLRDNYGVQPDGFYAHRELNSTACPGDLLFAKKQQLMALIFPVTAAAATGGDSAGYLVSLEELRSWR